VLKLAAFGGAAMLWPTQRLARAAGDPFRNRLPQSRLPRPFTVPYRQPPVALPVRSTADADYFRITMAPALVEIVPGLQTPMYAYNGTVPGPTFASTRGKPIVVRFVNTLPAKDEALGYDQWTSVHLHGSPSLPQFDGYASDITLPGQYKDYHYPNTPTARTLWYHDHGAHHTAENVYQGLFGMHKLRDPAEDALGLPTGEFDLPIVISDIMLQADGKVLFTLAEDNGMYGDIICVNGRPWPALKVKRRKYRFRVLNGSVSRSYNLSLSSGDSFQMIATDGGLMPSPQTVKSFRHSMGERYEIVVDFARYDPGKRIVLQNDSPKNNQKFPNIDVVMAFDVVDDAFDPSNNDVPSKLNPDHETMLLNESDAVKTRQVELIRTKGQWTVNRVTWQQIIDSNFKLTLARPEVGATEIWEVSTQGGGWFHPFHIHFVDFLVLSRNGQPAFAFERGPKDVVYVGENEKVRLLTRFDAPGKYMLHCHNAVHEDHDMMTQYEIVKNGVSVGNDPFSARAIDLPEATPL
jgi:FtsP/CotA-like multicopper oxidase with cupredoxin domain